jgi:hypothetical protein
VELEQLQKMGFLLHFPRIILISTLSLGIVQSNNHGWPQQQGHVTIALDSQSPTPKLNVTLTPRFDHGRASAIRVDLGLAEPNLRAQEVLLTVPIEIVTVDTGRFENDAVHAVDDNGELPLVAEQDPVGPTVVLRRWKAKRDTKGSVRAWYVALPRLVNETTKNSPSFDLREDQNGLFGSGYGFLAIPPYRSSEYEVHLRWNLTNAPNGTRAVWTYGEGPEEVIRKETASNLQQTYFAIGPLKSSQSKLSTHDGLEFGMYWFGEPPFNASKVAGVIQDVFLYMSKFFDDDEKSYRVFLRHNPYRGTGAGTALRRSFMFSYDDADFTNPPSVDSQTEFLAHEMVHNWATMDAAEHENWYSEGLAEYYSILLLYRGGFLTKSGYVKALNGRLTGYYTNPLIHLSNLDVSKRTWQTSDAQTLPYGRGFAFALHTNYLISTASKGRQSLDNLVLNIMYRDRKHEPAGIEEYLSLLSASLGSSTANELFKNMSSGTLVIPHLDSLASQGLRLERHDVERWDLGFDEASITKDKRIVQGLKPQSRAEAAGLRNGDRILNAVRASDLRKDVDAVMTLLVKRPDGKEAEIKFRPRALEKVEGYRYVALEKGSI